MAWPVDRAGPLSGPLLYDLMAWLLRFDGLIVVFQWPACCAGLLVVHPGSLERVWEGLEGGP